MAIERGEFYADFLQAVYGAADADGQYVEDAFFEIFCESLIEAGELDSADRVQYLASRGMRIDGYGGDPGTSGTLSLIIADFHQSVEMSTLTATEMNAIFRRAQNFLEKTLDRSFRESLEETNPAFGLADLIAHRWPVVQKVRLFLISNRVLSSRVDGVPAGEVKGTPLTYSVWDLERLYRFATSHGREPIKIDLVEDFGGPVAALPAHLSEAGYEAYLLVMPGEQLAAIYDRWGARLLEQNVRVFLQARGNVNKGIRNTIENDPEMFFAYNNGITATAESVKTVVSGGKLLVTGFQNLQIVNGGQTTASIHAASRKKDVDLSKVFVQMKLSIIEPARTLEVVPKISEYANSQNKVNAADFFANHPFHTRMEEFSRRIYAPAPDGGIRQSKWFYERARGQYQDARSNLTASQKKRFDLEYPKHQVFTKTDLAKYLNVWREEPAVVSKGAQKNFAYFASVVGEEWSKQSDVFNETYYRHVVAKLIVFRETERLVMNQPWYQGGYRANIVAYAIAKIASDVASLQRCVDFNSIWRGQAISPEMKRALTVAAEAANGVLMNPTANTRNVSEWAKHSACWSRLKTLKVDWPKQFLRTLLTTEDQRAIEKDGLKDQRMLNGIEAQRTVVDAGAEFWESTRAWGLERQLLSDKELGILEVALSIPRKIPSEKQSQVLMDLLERLRKEGCPLEVEVSSRISD